MIVWKKAAALHEGAYLAAVWHENNMAAMFCHLNVKEGNVGFASQCWPNLKFDHCNLVGIAFAEVVKEGKRSPGRHGELSQTNKRPVVLPWTVPVGPAVGPNQGFLTSH